MMTSQKISVQKVAARQWEVRAKDSHCNKPPLGTFYDEASRDLFIEALEALLLPSDDVGVTGMPARPVASVAA